jgi:superfamily I DNA and RNA helicase
VVHVVKINPSTYDFSGKEVLRDFVESIRRSALFEEGEVELFIDFPLYVGADDGLLVSQLILLSNVYGVCSCFASDATTYSAEKLLENDEQLLEISNNVFARLIRNKKLAKGFNSLKVNFRSILYAPCLDHELKSKFEFNNQCFTNFSEIEAELKSSSQKLLDEDFLECKSTIQGAKGLWKPVSRDTHRFSPKSRVSKVKSVESQILLFDKNQQEGYVAAPEGPQRIRGLAGSGKTVVLAMMAALTLIRSTDKKGKILYTFSTKSLYQHVQRLTQRFYREFNDDLSNLEKLSIKHSWGGRTNDGVYFEACERYGQEFMTFPQAKAKAPIGMDPFEFACKTLLDNVKIWPIYDYVFVDEAQDYGPFFIRLCTKMAINNRITLGSDVFQNIFQKDVPTADKIYDDGTHFIKETFLEVCYRTPLSTLVCAHAIGLGVYGNQVQKIETVEHWRSLGYSVLTKQSGPFDENEVIKIERRKENSPTLSEELTSDLIELIRCPDFSAEIEIIARKIINDINEEGLSPEDILVVCADDYNCRAYFSRLNLVLMDNGVATNNIHAEKYAIGDFRVENRVTLSTIHKAKGNEAYSVYLVGTDHLSHNLNVRNRNLIFTAFTRTKGWLTISGVGTPLDKLYSEIEQAMSKSPYIEFSYPSAADVTKIEHDLNVGDLIDPRDLSDYEKLIGKYGSPETIQKYIEEEKAKKGKKLK